MTAATTHPETASPASSRTASKRRVSALVGSAWAVVKRVTIWIGIRAGRAGLWAVWHWHLSLLFAAMSLPLLHYAFHLGLIDLDDVLDAIRGSVAALGSLFGQQWQPGWLKSAAPITSSGSNNIKNHLLLDPQGVAIFSTALSGAFAAFWARNWLKTKALKEEIRARQEESEARKQEAQAREHELDLMFNKTRYDFFMTKFDAFSRYVEVLEWYLSNAADYARLSIAVRAYPAIGGYEFDMIRVRGKDWITRSLAKERYVKKREELDRQKSLDALTDSMLIHFRVDYTCTAYPANFEETSTTETEAERSARQNDLRCDEVASATCVHNLATALANDIYRLLDITSQPDFAKAVRSEDDFSDRRNKIRDMDRSIQQVERKLRIKINMLLAKERDEMISERQLPDQDGKNTLRSLLDVPAHARATDKAPSLI